MYDKEKENKRAVKLQRGSGLPTQPTRPSHCRYSHINWQSHRMVTRINSERQASHIMHLYETHKQSCDKVPPYSRDSVQDLDLALCYESLFRLSCSSSRRNMVQSWIFSCGINRFRRKFLERHLRYFSFPLFQDVAIFKKGHKKTVVLTLTDHVTRGCTMLTSQKGYDISIWALF